MNVAAVVMSAQLIFFIAILRLLSPRRLFKYYSISLYFLCSSCVEPSEPHSQAPARSHEDPDAAVQAAAKANHRQRPQGGAQGVAASVQGGAGSEDGSAGRPV